MSSQQVILLVLNVLGGAAVLLSYVFGLRLQPGGASALWGGVPAGARPAYTVSMLLSAVSYLVVISYLLFGAKPSEITIAGQFGFNIFYAIFALILIPSALWMPLTNVYIGHSSPALWLGIRLVLLTVGLAAAALAWALCSASIAGAWRWPVVIGGVYFAFHTLILDALIWPALYK